MSKNNWLPEEDELIKQNSGKLSLSEIAKLLPRHTLESTKSRSCKLGLKPGKVLKYNLENLLLNVPQTYYWIGYLFADGHIYKDKMSLGLTSKDHEVIDEFCNYINCPNKNGLDQGKYKRTRVTDFHTITKLVKKFDFHHRKTYVPPNPTIIDDMTDDLFISFLIGFIDGDGCITEANPYNGNTYTIHIAVHRSWHEFFVKLRDRLVVIFEENIPDIKYHNNTHDGTVKLSITRFSIVQRIKEWADKLSLWYLDRKWSKINLQYEYLDQRARDKIEERVIELRKLGYLYKDIQKEVNISHPTISKICSKLVIPKWESKNARNSEVMKYYLEGSSQSDIRRKTGLSRETIRYIIQNRNYRQKSHKEDKNE